jgi:hypothetical protein
VVELQDSVAVPDPLMLFGITDPHDSPEGDVLEIVIVPENPFNEVRVTVEVADAPGATGAGEEALIVKSWKLKVVVAVWVSAPLVPVIVRL